MWLLPPSGSRSLPIFYFDVSDDALRPNPEGLIFASAEEAEIAGIVFAGEFLRDHPYLICGGQQLSVTIRDVRRKTIKVVSMFSSSLS